MNFSELTPFRQIKKLYIALLDSSLALKSISLSLKSLPFSADDYLADLSSKSACSINSEANVGVYAINDTLLLLDKTSLVDRMVIETGGWENAQVDYLKKISENFRGKDPIFLDLGSYWGHYSFNMLKLGIFKKIYAYDADAYNYSQFCANVFLNACEDVVIANHSAVSDVAGMLVMQKSKSIEDGNRGATRILSSNEVQSGLYNSREVPAVAIDDELDIQDSYLVIKMDVEGHEDKALLGMQKLIQNNKVIIQVEIYKEQTSRVLPVIKKLGLRKINEIYPDFYFTNIELLS